MVTGKFVTYRNPGIFLVTITGDEADAARPLVEKAVAEAAKPMAPAAFAVARAAFVYRLLGDMETPTEISDTYGWYAVEGGAAYAPAEGGLGGRYFTLASQLTPASVARTVATYPRPEPRRGDAGQAQRDQGAGPGVIRALAAAVLLLAPATSAGPAAARTAVADAGGLRAYVRSDQAVPLAGVALFVRAGLDRQTGGTEQPRGARRGVRAAHIGRRSPARRRDRRARRVDRLRRGPAAGALLHRRDT